MIMDSNFLNTSAWTQISVLQAFYYSVCSWFRTSERCSNFLNALLFFLNLTASIPSILPPSCIPSFLWHIYHNLPLLTSSLMKTLHMFASTYSN